jgi:hypothetical protein
LTAAKSDPTSASHLYFTIHLVGCTIGSTMNIYFEKSLKSDFMKAQGLVSDSDGYVVDSTTKKRVRDNSGKIIKVKSFGGVRKGSRIFLAENVQTVVEEARLNQAQ